MHYCLERRKQTGSKHERERGGRLRCTTTKGQKYRVSSLRNIGFSKEETLGYPWLFKAEDRMDNIYGLVNMN